MSAPITDILVIIALTLLEGFFVASEIALVSVRRSRIDQLLEEGNGAANRVRRLLDDPGRFLAVTQLGLTFLRTGLALIRRRVRMSCSHASSRSPDLERGRESVCCAVASERIAKVLYEHSHSI